MCRLNEPSKNVPERRATSCLHLFLGHLHPISSLLTAFLFTRCISRPHFGQLFLSARSLCRWHQCTVDSTSDSAVQRYLYVMWPTNHCDVLEKNPKLFKASYPATPFVRILKIECLWGLKTDMGHHQTTLPPNRSATELM